MLSKLISSFLLFVVKIFTPLQTFLWLNMTILFFLLINTNFLYLQHAIMLWVSSIFCKLTPSVLLSKMVDRAFALPFTVKPIFVIVRTHSTRYSRERSESLVPRHSGNKIKCFFFSFLKRKYFCISALASKIGQIIKIMAHYHAN